MKLHFANVSFWKNRKVQSFLKGIVFFIIKINRPYQSQFKCIKSIKKKLKVNQIVLTKANKGTKILLNKNDNIKKVMYFITTATFPL